MENAGIARPGSVQSGWEARDCHVRYSVWHRVVLGVVLAMQGVMPAYAQDSLLDRARHFLAKLVVVESPHTKPTPPASSVPTSSIPATDPYTQVIQAVQRVEYRFPHGRKTADGITMEPELGWAGLHLGASRHEIEQIIGAPLMIAPTRIGHDDYAGTESAASATWKGRDVVLSFDGSKLHAVYVNLPELQILNPAKVTAAQQSLDNAAPRDDRGEALIPTCQSATLSRVLGRLDVETEDCD